MAPKAVPKAHAKAKASPITHNLAGNLRASITRGLRGLRRKPIWLRNFERRVKSDHPVYKIGHCGTSRLSHAQANDIGEYLLTQSLDERGKLLALLQHWRPQILRQISIRMQEKQIRSRLAINRVNSATYRAAHHYWVTGGKLIMTESGIVMS